MLLVSRTCAPAPALATARGLAHHVLEVWAHGGGQRGPGPCRSWRRESRPLRAGETLCARTRAGGEVRLPADAEARLGLSVFRRGFDVDLRRPDAEVRPCSGRELSWWQGFAADRAGLHARSPRLRPFFHPGVIQPSWPEPW